MNKQIEQFARTELKKGLSKCNNGQQMKFKRMYSHKNLAKPIDDVVDDMPCEDLDWAMSQVSNTLKKRT